MPVLRFLVHLLCAFLLLGSVAIYAGDESALLNANTATNEQLTALPDLGDREIETIIEGRPYTTIGQLNAALSASLDEDQLKELYARLFLPINLNTAPEADILLIPGVDKRMAHEFEEYRPYKSMEQFRREIGKYVDKDEVARLETYVTLD
jgi:DNA uptake protein ComE-like DNA-binding protein